MDPRLGLSEVPVQILGIGTAVPAVPSPQSLTLERMIEVLGASSREAAIARRLFRRARVETRFFCTPIPSKGEGGDHARESMTPMEIFRREAPRLGALASRGALEQGATSPEEITHLVVVTSTGAITPGPDADLVDLLGLRPSVERVLVGFMGCSGAFQGLRVARRSLMSRHGSRALVVCIELSSIHYRPSADPGSIAAHALFGDGAAAMVLAAGVPTEDAVAVLGESACRLETGFRDLLSWDLGPAGFDVVLSPELPRALEAAMPRFIESLLKGRAPKEVPSWVLHPGGPAILNAAVRALELDPDALESSFDVLRSIGNVSSGSVLFVLERELARSELGTDGLMLGFGPGLTLEAVQYQRGGRSMSRP